MPSPAVTTHRRTAAAAVVAVALCLSGLGGATAASAAEDPGSDELVGTLVRAYDMDGMVAADPTAHTAAGAAAAAADEHAGMAGMDHSAPATSTGTATATSTATSTSTGQDESDGMLAWVQAPGGTVRVPVADVAALPTGATVAVTVGDEVSDLASRGGLDPARELLSADVLAAPATGGAAGAPGEVPLTGDDTATAPAPGALAGARIPEGAAAATTPAVHDVTVVLAVPAGGSRDGATTASVSSAVTGPVSSFWSGQTGGAVSFRVSRAVDWVDLSASCSDPTAVWQEAARRAGFTPGANKHLLVYIGDPDNAADCSASGVATVGSSTSSGGYLYVTSLMTSLVSHELGHNLGLYHSARLQCPGAVEATSGCTTTDYLDLYDVMGGAWSQTGSLSAQHAAELGVLTGAEGADVTGSGGTFSLAPISTRGSLRAVRLVDASGTYWVEYRAAEGQDAWLSATSNVFGLQSGVVVRRQVASPTNWSSVLLDTTPSPAAQFALDQRVALTSGAGTVVSGGRWKIEVLSASSSAARVSISATSPSVTASPGGGGFTGVPSGAVPAFSATTSRYEGATRYDTAVAISRADFPSGAGTAVVASGEAFPDALAAGPVAAAAGGPLLLVPATGAVPAAVTAELTRLRPSSIVVAGGQSAVSQGVAAQLAAVAPVTRVRGEDRYDTAAALTRGLPTSPTPGGTVFLASGLSHADAVAGSALAAQVDGAVLLTGPGGLPATTRAALVALAPSAVVVLGGTTSIPAAVADQVRSAVPSAAISRSAGEDRYETAAAIAAAGHPDGATTAYLALGDTFPDALAGAPSAGRIGAPLLLTRGGCVPAATLQALIDLGVEDVRVLGGTGVVSPAVEAFQPC